MPDLLKIIWYSTNPPRASSWHAAKNLERFPISIMISVSLNWISVVCQWKPVSYFLTLEKTGVKLCEKVLAA
jgi:hypothetical protein